MPLVVSPVIQTLRRVDRRQTENSKKPFSYVLFLHWYEYKKLIVCFPGFLLTGTRISFRSLLPLQVWKTSPMKKHSLSEHLEQKKLGVALFVKFCFVCVDDAKIFQSPWWSKKIFGSQMTTWLEVHKRSKDTMNDVYIHIFFRIPCVMKSVCYSITSINLNQVLTFLWRTYLIFEKKQKKYPERWFHVLRKAQSSA